MKILIGTHEIAGWIQSYKTGFELNGHQVTTAVFEQAGFYNYQYDYNLNEYYHKGRHKKAGIKSHHYLERVKRKIKNRNADSNYRKFITRLIDEHDIIVVMWSSFRLNYFEYQYIREKKKKFVCLFVGSDARYFRAFKNEFDVSQWSFNNTMLHNNPAYHLKLIRNAEKYADIIYSVPDQAGLQLRPYHHLQVPVLNSNIIFQNNKRDIPVVVHAPSIPYKKGTDIIENTLQQLKEEGVQFEFVSLRNMANKELMNVLNKADILIDEIVYHGPGALSFEAMLSGCAVATRCMLNSPVSFMPPVWHIDAYNIHDRLRHLFTDKNLRNKLIEDGREYAMQHNTAEIVTKGILADLDAQKKYDYYPTYLRQQFKPDNNSEKECINQWTGFVKECDWYKSYISPGEREGLLF